MLNHRLIAAIPSGLTVQSLANAGNESGGVLVVELVEDFVGQVYAGDVPKALRWEGALGVREIFIVGFEKAPVEADALFGPGAVGAEQNAILIFFKEGASGSRLT